MKWYKNFVIFWTAIYLAIAFLGRFSSSDKEYFPFFRWSLYSKTPNYLEIPIVLVSKYGDEILNPPINITELSFKHHISSVDMNLNVVNFYNDFKNGQNIELLYKSSLFISLPIGSEFSLQLKTLDLTQKHFRLNSKPVKLLDYSQNQFHVIQR